MIHLLGDNLSADRIPKYLEEICANKALNIKKENIRIQGDKGKCHSERMDT
ncbi:MAG: hypothetical protein HQM14_15170 [SAR324 cluster bacterium]|nr:hypothetical protein [SAR324 cluster bacterium]